MENSTWRILQPGCTRYAHPQDGDGSTLQYTWTRIDPIYPYAPTASGTTQQIDQSVILPTPAGTIAFTITSPKCIRPPARYRFAANYLPLQPGEKLVGSPTRFIDGVSKFTGTSSTIRSAPPESMGDVLSKHPMAVSVAVDRRRSSYGAHRCELLLRQLDLSTTCSGPCGVTVASSAGLARRVARRRAG